MGGVCVVVITLAAYRIPRSLPSLVLTPSSLLPVPGFAGWVSRLVVVDDVTAGEKNGGIIGSGGGIGREGRGGGENKTRD